MSQQQKKVAQNILMVQGTTSDAGKTTLVAGLCRYFANKGWQVAPFKPQNMALNSAVTDDGGEIGRAQALQAIAARVKPHTDFNPILLKPSSDSQAQVIIHGKALANMEAAEYFGKDSQGYRVKAMAAVEASLSRLQQQYQCVLVEGAGSPAEINLREGDIANMGFAEHVDCPVIIIADIDKGGVFAHLVGTLALLSESEQARVKGFVINRFRGDISLLQSGIDWLEQYTQKPVLGVLPYINDFHLDAEDAIDNVPAKQAASFKVLVLVWPRVSNHTDFDPLRLNPDVEFQYVHAQQQVDWQSLPQADLIILPGSKNVREDLAVMLKLGWDKAIQRHLRYGGKVLGICGGYQMLGLAIDDPLGIESAAGESEGLGLLPIVTTLTANKCLTQVSGQLHLDGKQAQLQGYEIHCGQSQLLNQPQQPLTLSTDTASEFFEGCLSDDGQILGTYVHGLFDHPQAGQLLLQWAGMQKVQAIDISQQREMQLQRLADGISRHLDMRAIEAIITGES